jgi:hypothetical protein
MQSAPLAYTLAFGFLWSYAAIAQELPRFDIQASCRSAQALTAEDRDPIQGCIRDEANAESQLRTVWKGATAAHRESCAAQAQLVGSPSYVDMLVCLQMYQGAASTAPPQRRRQP